MKSNSERHQHSSREYPPVNVGDMVRLCRRRRNFEKENVSLWTDKKYEVKRIEDVPQVGKLYHLDGVPNGVLRSEILL